MSSKQGGRTVERFPRMNDRAGRRRHRRMVRKITSPTFMQVMKRALDALGDAFYALGAAAARAVQPIVDIALQIRDVIVESYAAALRRHTRPFPDGGAWVLRALPAEATS